MSPQAQRARRTTASSLYAGSIVTETTEHDERSEGAATAELAGGAVTGSGAEGIDELVAEWKAALDGQQSVSATDVQDRLLDLWGRLPAGEVRGEIEQWLTETVQRHLYAAADVDARLGRVLAGA